MAQKRKTILLFYNYLSSFVKKDVEMLHEVYEVKGFDFYTEKKSGTPFSFIKQLFFILRHVWTADLIVCQFAGYHSVLPVLFGRLTGRPSLVIVGGTDAHYFPNIGYGNWQKRGLEFFTRLTFIACTHIAPKHRSLMEYDYSYDTQEPSAQGIYARIPGLKTPYTEIPNGYDAEQWQASGARRPNTFITVSGAWEYPFQVQLKGIDLILSVAPRFPECRFIILGIDSPDRLPTLPANVELLPATPNNQLPIVFSSCTYYLQLSMAEGFPNALCESMLCGCVPVVSAVFSMPEIVGESGFVLPLRNSTALQGVLNAALEGDWAVKSKAARERIVTHYTQRMRREKLLALCDRLMAGN